MMTPLTISTNHKYQSATANDGFKPVNVNSDAELVSLAKMDFSPTVYYDGYRSGEKWAASMLLFCDVDNADGDEVTIEDFLGFFPGVEVHILTSRNHQKAKSKKTGGQIKNWPARDRFHALFPVDWFGSFQEHDEALKALQKKHSFMDPACADAVRKFFGNSEVKHVYQAGSPLDWRSLVEECRQRSREAIRQRPEMSSLPVMPKSSLVLTVPQEDGNLPDNKREKVLRALQEGAKAGLWSNYDEWLQIGFGFHREGFSLSDWQSVSYQDEQTQRECEFKWKSFKDSTARPVTMGTLLAFARRVDPDLLVKKDRAIVPMSARLESEILRGNATEEQIERASHESADQYGQDRARLEGRLTQFNQLAMAYNVALRIGHLIRYRLDVKSWLVWDGKRWSDAQGQVYNLIRQAIEHVEADLAPKFPYPEKDKKPDKKSDPRGYEAWMEQEEKAQAFTRWCTGAKTATYISSVAEILSTMDEDDADMDLKIAVPVASEELDANPYLFNLQNGTYDLQLGVFRPHLKTDRITKISQTRYDPKADCPKFKAFLSKIFYGKEDVITFLRQYFGFCLSGLPPERVVVFFYGKGSNGKSTLVNAISHVMGDYVKAAKIETFLANDNSMDKIGQDVLLMKGARIITAQESEEGQKLSLGRLKQMSGKDKLNGRFNHGREEFQFVNTGKLIFSTNNKPTISMNDDAFWDRMRMIHFEYRFDEKERVENFEDQLFSEASGILNWMIQGWQEFINAGRKLPRVAEITEATEEYRLEEDKVGMFFEECCLMRPEGAVKTLDLYRAYTGFCKSIGITKPLSSRAFYSQIRGRHGISQVRRNTGFYMAGMELTSKGEEFSAGIPKVYIN